MNRKEREMRKEALETIIEALRSGWRGYFWDLLHEAFYMDYYIVGRYRAEKALEEYGIFRAIERVRDYEIETFGKVNTDVSDPEKLVNVLYCIIAEEVLHELWELVDDEWEYDLGYIDEKASNKILKIIEKNRKDLYKD